MGWESFFGRAGGGGNGFSLPPQQPTQGNIPPQWAQFFGGIGGNRAMAQMPQAPQTPPAPQVLPPPQPDQTQPNPVTSNPQLAPWAQLFGRMAGRALGGGFGSNQQSPGMASQFLRAMRGMG